MNEFTTERLCRGLHTIICGKGKLSSSTPKEAQLHNGNHFLCRLDLHGAVIVKYHQTNKQTNTIVITFLHEPWFQF
jgi:hypothetical protein